MEPRQFGAGPGFGDEHGAMRIVVELAFEPRLSASYDVGTILLRCMAGLFLSVIFRRAKNRHSVAMPTLTPCPLSISRSSAKVISGCLATAPRITSAWASIRPERRSPPAASARHGPRSAPSAGRRPPLRRGGTCPSRQRMPPDRARHADTETRRGLAPRQAAIDHRHNTLTKIVRQRLAHAR